MANGNNILAMTEYVYAMQEKAAEASDMAREVSKKISKTQIETVAHAFQAARALIAASRDISAAASALLSLYEIQEQKKEIERLRTATT